MTERTFIVNGMSCSMCVKHVTNAILGLEGVRTCDVNLEKKNVKVEYDETKTGYEIMREALEEEGYDLEER